MRTMRLVCLLLLAISLPPALGRAALARPVLHIAAHQVPKYGKVELQIDFVDASGNPAPAPETLNAPGDRQDSLYDRYAAAFLRQGAGAQLDIAVIVTTPGGATITLPAFYDQPYEYRRLGDKRNSEWLHPTGEPAWKARFAPAETGVYHCQALYRAAPIPAPGVRSSAVSFECVPSASKGFVRVAARDPRFFELSEGGAFFPIGQDLAFIGDIQYLDLARTRAIFQEMGRNGANYVRVWACCGDWGMAIEYPKSAWQRSWEKHSPLVEAPWAPGRQVVQLEPGKPLSVSPSHAVALRPKARHVLSGRVRLPGGARLGINLGGKPLGEPIPAAPVESETAWRREFITGPEEWRLPALHLELQGGGPAWLSELSLKENGAGPELLWEASLNHPRRGWYNPQDCFMLDQVVEAAEAGGIRLQLCLLERNLYMKELKNPASPEYDKAIADAQNLLRYAVARWGYSTAVATWEYWNEENPGLPTDRFYAEVGRYLEAIDPYHHLRATSAWGPSEKDWRHPQLDAADLHHYMRPVNGEQARDEVAAALERAAFLRRRAPGRPAMLTEFGLADDKWGLSPYMRQDRELRHLHNALWASALSGLSGATLFWWWEQLDQMGAYRHYRPLAAFVADIPFGSAPLRPAEASASDARLRIAGLQTADRADLWLFNREAAWARRIIDKAQPTAVHGAALELRGLAPGRYRVEWWDADKGKAIAHSELRVESQGSSQTQPVARCVAPPFTSDIACKIRRAAD